MRTTRSSYKENGLGAWLNIIQYICESKAKSYKNFYNRRNLQYFCTFSGVLVNFVSEM